MDKKRVYVLIADESGDTRIMIEWTPGDRQSELEAKTRFMDYRKKGYLFYECKGFLGKYKPKGKPVKSFDTSSKRLVGEKHFDDLKEILSEEETSSVKVEEVILTQTVSDTEEMEIFNPETEDLTDGATYGSTPTIMGG